MWSTLLSTWVLRSTGKTSRTTTTIRQPKNYLSLLMSLQAAKLAVRRLRAAPLVHRKAKDLLRASRLPILAPDNRHVARDLKKISSGQLLSPVLLVRGRLASDSR